MAARENGGEWAVRIGSRTHVVRQSGTSNQVSLKSAAQKLDGERRGGKEVTGVADRHIPDAALPAAVVEAPVGRSRVEQEYERDRDPDGQLTIGNLYLFLQAGKAHSYLSVQWAKHDALYI